MGNDNGLINGEGKGSVIVAEKLTILLKTADFYPLLVIFGQNKLK